jgi:hypothetical protein
MLLGRILLRAARLAITGHSRGSMALPGTAGTAAQKPETVDAAGPEL